MSNNAEKLRSYFLGSLPNSDQEEIELRLIDDAEFESEVVAAEGNLVEDYLDNLLNSEEKKLFTENYLITPERRMHVESVAMLRQHARKQADTPARIIEPEKISVFEQLMAPFRRVPAVAYAAILVLLIGGLVAVLWIERSGSQYSALQTEYAKLNQEDLTDIHKDSGITVVAMTNGRSRGSASGEKVGPPATHKTLLRLNLMPEFRGKQPYIVSLKKSNEVLMRFDGLREYGTELRVLVPSKVLAKGEYLVEVAPAETSEYSISYYLTVE